MTHIVVSPRASADIEEILERLAERGGVAVAERYA